MIPLGQIAAKLGATLHGDPALPIDGVADLAAAGPGQLTFLTDASRLDEALRSGAAGFVVRRRWPALPAPQLVCADPAQAMSRVLALLRPVPADARQGVDPRAAVAADATVAAGAWVGPFAFVDREARIGEGARVEPFAYVGAGAVLGRRCHLGPGAVVCAGCELGDDVRLGPGAVLGGDGFGFHRDAAGWQRIPSRGTVVLGDGAELGANSCVDRGTLGATEVGPGAKIDNLVQVGHNATIGARALLCAQVGVAGSARIGADAQLGGQVGVADHRTIGAGARVGAQSGVARDVPEGAAVSGYPAIDRARWLRASGVFAQLGELAREVRRLRAALAAALAARER